MNVDVTASQLVLDGETDIIVRRDFAHPPAKVWRALTEPALIGRWLGQGGFRACRMDVRPGGEFTYEFEAFAFSGEFLVVEPPHRMTYFETFSLDPAYRVDVSTELAAQGSGTRMTVVMRYADAAARAAAIADGFTSDLDNVYGRIDTLQIAD